MTFRRFINIATWVFVVLVLAAILLHSCERQKLKAEIMSLSDEQYLINVLRVRAADDCKVTPIENGWRCVEFRTGRIFIVRRP